MASRRVTILKRSVDILKAVRDIRHRHAVARARARRTGRGRPRVIARTSRPAGLPSLVPRNTNDRPYSILTRIRHVFVADARDSVFSGTTTTVFNHPSGDLNAIECPSCTASMADVDESRTVGMSARATQGV